MTQTNPKAYVSVTVTEGGSSSVWHSPSACLPLHPAALLLCLQPHCTPMHVSLSLTLSVSVVLHRYRYGPAPTTWPCHQHLLLGVGLGGCAGRGADSTSGHSACPRCSPALALGTEVAFPSVWKVQDQNQWQRSKGLGKHSQSVAILIQTVLCLLVNLLIFLTAMLQKERTKILPGDSKRTQGSKVPRSFKSVLRISYGGVIPTKPLALTSSWLQDDCFCNALRSPCSSTA